MEISPSFMIPIVFVSLLILLCNMGLSPTIGGIIESGLGFLGSIGSSVANAKFAAREAEKDRQFQKSMYEQQVKDNLDFWNRTNQYNLPSAARQRIEDAGLNPLLMYSGSGVSGNIAQQPQPGTAPHGSTARSSFQNPLQIANLGLVQAQADLMESEAAKNRQDVKESKQREYGKAIENEVAFRTRDAVVAAANKNVDKLDREIDWLATQDFALTNMTAANLANISQMMEYRQKYYDLDEQQALNKMWYNVEQIAIGRAHVSNELKGLAIDLYNAKTNRKKVDSEIKVFAAQVNEINARKDLTDKQKSHEILKAYNQMLKNDMLENVGTEQLGGAAGLMLLLSGTISGRID